MDEALVDSSFLYALYGTGDRYHEQAVNFARDSRLAAVVPDVVLPEVTFLLNRAGGLPAVLAFLEAFGGTQATIECLLKGDIARAHEIMGGYPDARLDFVDCCVMAMAERLDVTHICTYDRRDFSIFRPTHCDHLTLLP
jgi:predicted nucleic acid-binding protein